MRSYKDWLARLTLIWLIGLIVFSGCRTIQGGNAEAEQQAVFSALTPIRPAAPAMEAVVFEDKDGGLWLAYKEYRALERNIIALREYTAKLETIIDFYEEEASRKYAY
jgi:hypothetical protein